MYQPNAFDASQHAGGANKVGKSVQLLSVVGGAALAAFGILRRGTITIPAVIGGAALILRGLTGQNALFNTPSDAPRSRVASVPQQQGFHVERAVTINRPVEELYNFWHEPTNLPRVLKFVDSVQVTGENRAHWTLKLPGGMTTELDVEVYTDVPNEVISWRSLPESPLQTAGAVRFLPAPADRGTLVRLTVEFVPPFGPLGQKVLSLFSEAPVQYIGQYMREFKQMMEAGEIATTEGQPSGRKGEVSR